MFFSRNPRLAISPWRLIQLITPLTAIIPFAVYHQTLFTHVYPGVSAYLTAYAAGLCQQEDLSNPLFMLAIRAVAALPYATLPIRVNLFSALCGALTVAFFYLLTTRLIFIFASEDPGGAMAALPPDTRGDTDDTDTPAPSLGLAVNADGTPAMPAAVFEHNRRASHAAIIGGVGAAMALAFSAPFWLVSTRLYPHTFDLALFFLIANLLVSYDQYGHSLYLFAGTFLLAACVVESPLFILLALAGGFFLLRSMNLSGQATTYRVTGVVLIGIAGGLTALFFLWQASAHCAAIPIPAIRPILNVYYPTVLREVIQWVPGYGWSFIFVQILFPVAISFFVFSHAFRERTAMLFLLQLVLISTLIPSLLNLSVSPWAIARHTFKIPVYSYTLIALLTGFTIAVWHLMREAGDEKVDVIDLDFYEYHDNPIVCRIGAFLCWPLLLLTCLMPFRTRTDITSTYGIFADTIADALYQDLGARDWLVNSRLLPHHLMIRAHRDGRRLMFISTDPTETRSAKQLETAIRTQPSFEPYRTRLLNAADLSTASFLREWLKHETNAFERIVIFDNPTLWTANGFASLPTGLFLSGAPATTEIDTPALIAHQQEVTRQLTRFILPEKTDSIRYFGYLRLTVRRQLARMANELGVLLATQGKAPDAMACFKEAERLAPENLSALINRYHLVTSQNLPGENLADIEARLRVIPQRVNTFKLSAAALQEDNGSLISPESFDSIRTALWVKAPTFRNLAISASSIRSDPLTALRDKKRELYNSITKNIDAHEFADADREIDLLLGLDAKDHFALIHKARTAIERRDIPAGLRWMERAVEHGVPDADLTWHNAAILIQNGKLAEARDLLNRAIPSSPSDIGLWGLMAHILLQLNEYYELESRVFPSIRSASSKGETYLLHLVRGYILKNNGPSDFLSARNSFLRALSLNKNLTDVREELLRLDDTLDVPAFSEEDAKEVLRSDPDHAFANFLWGMVRLRRNELDLAEDLFLRSLAKERSAPAYAGLGAVTFEKGRIEPAEKLLRLSLEMEPSRLFTSHTLAKLLLASDRTDEAARVFEPVLSGQPDNLEAQLTLIRLRMKQNRLEEAATLISDLLDKDDLLPRPIHDQLQPLAALLSKKLAN